MARAQVSGLGVRRANAIAVRSDTRSVQAIRALEMQIRGDIWNRWLAIAQKRALIWWRNRTVPPGLAARFTIAGIRYYGFGSRLRKPSAIPPYFKVTGALERALMKRNPKTAQASKNGGVVTTTLKFGGLSLNLMLTSGKPDMRPVVGYTKTLTSRTESFSVASYTRSYQTKSGVKSVTIPSYSMSRQVKKTKTTANRAGDPHGVSFGRFVRDAPAIQARVMIEMRKIIRRAAYDKRTGLIKSSVISQPELAGAIS